MAIIDNKNTCRPNGNLFKHESNQDKRNPKRCESTMPNACPISSPKKKTQKSKTT